jgi:RimJ/RimL family protein N-acetyltransferase
VSGTVFRRPWDSEFFGVTIGEAHLRACHDLGEIDRSAREQGIRCVYLLVGGGDLASVTAAERDGFSLTGIRLTCALEPQSTRHTSPPGDSRVAIRAARAGDVHELERIAANAHRETRFYADAHFPRETCDRLYRTWIRRSCEGWADGVFVADDEGRPVGYVTVHKRAEGPSSIGLFGVAPDARGRGVGGALLQAAVAWFDAEQLHEVVVMTQAQSVGAVRAYQRAGFAVAEVHVWLHKWFT